MHTFYVKLSLFIENYLVFRKKYIRPLYKIKGIRDAGSTADFRILFEVLKFGNLKILKIWKILEHSKKFRTFGKF